MRLFPKRKPVQRSDQRIPTFGIVEIRNGSGTTLERATLRDLSRNGALIQLAAAQQLPDAISVWFPADRLQKSATIRWREGRSIGVEFDEPIVLPQRLEHRKNRAEVVASHFRGERA